MAMKIDEVMEVIRDLSKSQGFYGRLYEELSATEKWDPAAWKLTVQKIEAEKFDTVLDVVLYFEEGKHHAKFWKIPVTWECYGTVEMPGETVEEALANFHAAEDELGLPDDGEYVDGSFRLSDDDEDELKSMIELMNK